MKAEERGFHGGKKVKGRSRQAAVDTEGNLWAVHVHAANGADTVEGCVLADIVLAELPSVKALCADQGCRGTFVDYVELEWEREVHISQREGKGFELEPRRWVPRSFGGSRRRAPPCPNALRGSRTGNPQDATNEETSC